MTPIDVWVAMAEIYGERWTRLMGDTPNDAWSAGIASLNDAQLKRAGPAEFTQPEVASSCRYPTAAGRSIRHC